ncbi:MAG TPA: hypothetical protein VK738_11110 [Terriglobales bacterium]|nr:hypothetical protein [Terriglobales bacterium]
MKKIGTALALGILWLVFQGTITGQEKQKMSRVTDTDNRYGKGGTLTTYYDPYPHVTREEWTDKDGRVRELHINDSPHRGEQVWFFQKDGKVIEFLLSQSPGKGQWHLSRGNGTFSGYSDGRSADLPKEDLLKIMEKAEKQFAADGKISDQIFEADTNVEQPILPPNEIFSCRRVDLATAKDSIEKKIKHIEERRKLMSDAFYYEGAVQTLQAAFKAKGVTSSMSSADPWGKSGIGSAWTESGEGFYKNHVEALNQLLGVVGKRGYSTESEMARLEQAMTRWEKFDSDIESRFKALVDAYTIEAKAYDEQNDYMAKYFQQLGQLQTRNPYPSDAIDSLNGKMYSNKKSFDDRIKKMEDVDQQEIRDRIKALASEQIFKSLTETSDCTPGTKEQKK